VLADAKQVKNLPGRPNRDPADSRWLAACFERGAITSCFVATPEFRIIRLHTRYRRDLTEERTREKQRAEKLLESAAVKISSVVTDLHGVTGRDIMDHLIARERNPKVLAQLARAAARRKSASWKKPWRARSSSPPITPRCWPRCCCAALKMPMKAAFTMPMGNRAIRAAS
jgi:transposase